MATILKAGAIKIDLEANAKNLIDGFKSALDQMGKFGKTTDEVTSKSKRLTDQLKDLQRRKETLIERIKQATEKYGANSVQVKGLQDRVDNLNDRIATQNLRISESGSKMSWWGSVLSGTGSILGKVGSGFSSFGGVVLGVIGNITSSIQRMVEYAFGQLLYDGIKRFATFSFNATANLQDVRGGFEAMLGSAEQARDLLGQLSEYNKKTPFELPQLQEQAANLLAIGFAADELIPTLDVLGKISRGNARRFELLALAFGQVKSAGKLTGAELRQFTENGVPLLELLANQTKMSMGEVREAISNGQISFEQVDTALKSTVKESGRFFNYFEKNSKNFSFVWSNISDQFGILGRSIMGITEQGDIIEGKLFDKIVAGSQKFLNALNENQQAISDFIGKGLDHLVSGIGWFVDNAWPKLVDAFKWMKNVGIPALVWWWENKLIPEFKAYGETIKWFIDTIWNPYFKPALEMMAVKFKEIYDILQPYMIPTLKIVAGLLGGALLLAIVTIVGALYFLGSLLAGAVKAFENLGTVGTNIMNWFSGNVNARINEMKATWDALTWFMNLSWQDKIKTIAYWAGWVAGQIYNFFTNAINWVLTKFNEIVEWHKALPSKIVQFADNAAKEFVTKMNQMKDDSISKLKEFVGFIQNLDLKKIAGDAIQGFIEGVKNKIKEIPGLAKQAADSFAKGFKDALQIKSPSRLFEYYGEMTGAGYEEGINTSFESASSVAVSYMTPQSLEPSQNVNNAPINISVGNYLGTQKDKRELIDDISSSLIQKFPQLKPTYGTNN